MKLVSLNVSMGRTVRWEGRDVETGIFKESVPGPLRVTRHNLEGDRQSDLQVHGGEFKAIYAYSAEHYAWWNRELGRALPYGTFGENLTLEGFTEEEVCVGDRLRVGTAVLEAVQPRFPCFKLGIRFGDMGIVEKFLDSGRFGVYFRVAEEGVVAAGDSGEWVHRDPARFPVPEILRLSAAPSKPAAELRRALSAKALPPSWREKFSRRLSEAAGA
ncbi:MAG: MOSC domain-containing protein [Elusimicrobiota bacterium]